LSGCNRTPPLGVPPLGGSEMQDHPDRLQDGRQVTLSELRGQTVLLVFYPLDFSPVCTDQLSVYQQVLGELEDRDVKLIGISVDSATRSARVIASSVFATASRTFAHRYLVLHESRKLQI